MDSINKVARLIGVLLLVLVVIAPFSMLYVPSTLIAAGDAVATTSNVACIRGSAAYGGDQ